jgi:hypothetical protein
MSMAAGLALNFWGPQFQARQNSTILDYLYWYWILKYVPPLTNQLVYAPNSERIGKKEAWLTSPKNNNKNPSNQFIHQSLSIHTQICSYTRWQLLMEHIHDKKRRRVWFGIPGICDPLSFRHFAPCCFTNHGIICSCSSFAPYDIYLILQWKS